MIKVLIADDHPVVRQGLKQIIEETTDITVGGDASDGVDLLKKVRSGRWDAVLMDMAMPGTSGLDLLKQIKSENPKLPVLVLTVYSEDQYAIRVLQAGASGYLTKGCPPNEVIDAIRKVAGGGKYITESLAEKLAVRLDDDGTKSPHELLSDREYQVLCMIASGKTVSEIGHKLRLSVKTISTYRSRVLVKMKLKNNAQLTQYAVHSNLVE